MFIILKGRTYYLSCLLEPKIWYLKKKNKEVTEFNEINAGTKNEQKPRGFDDPVSIVVAVSQLNTWKSKNHINWAFLREPLVSL